MKGLYIVKEFFADMKQHVTSFLQWQWVKKFVYWVVVSAGTVAECIFLIASIWVSLNATVHPLMLKVMSEAQTFTLSELSISAFTALPEIILGLAVVTTYGQIKTYCLHRRNSSLTWSILFGLPTLVFAGLTIWTLCASALQIGYSMPAFLIATRVLAGYVYGFVTMLFVLIQEPDTADYVSRLKSEHADSAASFSSEIVVLKQHINELETAYSIERQELITSHSTQVSELTDMLKTQTRQVNILAEKASSLVSQELAHYQKVTDEWLNQGIKTVAIEDIVRVTGHSRQRINGALTSGKLKTDRRNSKLIRVSSVIEWLKAIPAPSVETVQLNGNGNGHTQDTDPFLLPVYSLESE